MAWDLAAFSVRDERVYLNFPDHLGVYEIYAEEAREVVRERMWMTKTRAWNL